MHTQFWYGVLVGGVLVIFVFAILIKWTIRASDKKYEAGREKFDKEVKNSLNEAYAKGVTDTVEKTKKLLAKKFNPDRTVRVIVAREPYKLIPKDARIMLLKDHNWQQCIGEVFIIVNNHPGISEVHAVINFNRNLSDAYVDALKALYPTIGGQYSYDPDVKSAVRDMTIYEVSLCTYSQGLPSIAEQVRQQEGEGFDLSFEAES